MLTNDRVCDTILPRLTQRYVLEDSEELEPRYSPLEIEMEEMIYSEEDILSIVEDEEQEVIEVVMAEPLTELPAAKKSMSKKKVKSLFKAVKPNQKVEEPATATTKEYEKEGLSILETNKLRASLGLNPLK